MQNLSGLSDEEARVRLAPVLAARRACEEEEMGPQLGSSGRQFIVNDETSQELTQAGIQLEDGILGYSRTYTIKPAVRVADRKRVAVKLYNDTTQAKTHHLPAFPTRPRVTSARQDELAAEFAREMNIVAAMDMYHPHLLRILSWSNEPHKWVCCELFDANLFKYIRNTQPWRVEAHAHLFTHLMSPIASAVAFLHSKNYVHKDINSHHVLFLEDFSRVVLSGHKLSKSLADSGYYLSSAKRGECQWMDPECYKRTYSMESDVYSLGVIIGELLTGEQPYNGDAQGRVISKQKAGDPPFFLSHAVRARWPRLCALYYQCTSLSSTVSGASGSSVSAVGGGDAMMTDAMGEARSLRPGAQQLADALLVAAVQDAAGAAWEGPDMFPNDMQEENSMAVDRFSTHGVNVNSNQVVDRVYNSHKLTNKLGTYRNCVVQ